MNWSKRSRRRAFSAIKETKMTKFKRNRPKVGLLGTLIASLALLGAAPAAADFGFEEFDATFLKADGTPATQAGSHPFSVANKVKLNHTGLFPLFALPDEPLKTAKVEFPPGFIGDATARPRCDAASFALLLESQPQCTDSTALGTALIKPQGALGNQGASGAIYNLEPPPGTVTRFGFVVLPGIVTVVDVRLNDAPPYNVVATLANAGQPLAVLASELTLWGDPTDPAHDTRRGHCLTVTGGNSKGSCPVSPADRPFLTLPGSCTGPVPVNYEIESWVNPGKWVTGAVLTHDNATPPSPIGFSGCGKLGFDPLIKSLPTSDSAGTGTGLDFSVEFDDEGLTSPDGLAQSSTKKAVVTLPEGVTINPSIGEGLGVCTPADLKREKLESDSGDGCPNSSKIGTLDLETPLVDERIEGSVYLAEQDDPRTSKPGAENPFDSLIAMYLVLRNETLGVNVKLPAKVEPDLATGQLVTTLNDIPQVPFSRFNFHFKEGQRAALVTPSHCGTYETEAVFTPWSEPGNPRTIRPSFEITSGVDGGPCPSRGIPPFNPHFEAGSLNNNAGSFSPFSMRLLRSDGEQDMTKFSSVLPPGVLGSLAGVSKCPDANIAIAKTKTGREELAAPSCQPNSAIGRTLAGAGVGSALTYVGGGIFLGGPYKGAPLSVISITPAVAGPFDAGTVVVRLGLTLNPVTAEVEVDGAASDPIPHILKGIVLKVRDLRVYVDRPGFTLNPTSCDESSARATLFGSFLNVIDPADDVPVPLSTRYQAANCLALGYKPNLNINLKGGTRRGAFPAFRANYKPRSGDANIEGLVLRLPRSAFLEQSHIRTICTRVQFAADACPKASQYGYVRAWTPLLDEPLQGPVYLRSSNNKLPDVVFDLKGIVDIEVATAIDSVRGGIRATLTNLPDAPISRVLLRMQGGKKGLIVNSRNLCRGKSRANLRFTGQNGKRLNRNPVVRASCGKRKRARRSSHGRADRAALGGLSTVG